MSALLSVTGLSVLGPRGRLVEPVDLALDPGETVAIVGESGSGKSMTAKALTGLLPSGVRAAGTMLLGGRELDLAAGETGWRGIRGGGIALLLQDPFTSLSPVHRCGDQIGWGLTGSRRTRSARVATLLAEVGLPERVAGQYPFELSGGMRQRVALAAALAADPQVLIADEPTTALDVTTQKDVLDLIAGLQRSRDMGLILITHDLGVARSRADRILVMYAGRLVEQGSAAAVLDTPGHPYSARLLGCEPPLDRQLTRLASIAGSVPQPYDVGAACAFAPRCMLAVDACVAAAPPLVAIGPGHAAACVRTGEVLDDPVGPTVDGPRPEPVESPETGEVIGATGAVPLLRVADLTRRFHGTETPALDGVSLEVAQGESVAVVGESGSGKTTLARCVVGLEHPDSGSIELAGGADGRAQRVQIVFQDPYSALNPGLTIGTTLRETLRAAGRPAELVEGLLELVGLPAAYARRRPKALSGGERQRVAIARALAVEPDLLVLDESVSALDVSVQAQVLNLLRDLQQRLDLTLLFITHDLAVARQVSQRVYVMRAGRVVEHGPTDAVLARPQQDYTQRLLASVPSAHRTED
ncbi:dipeptide ABC transporter ATP-binding protein [Nocardioides sp. Iso805N]|uniref:dipeptide ABC transporter ATP-binding protein n=1 Tax=Nocardioides sp. Iso805N TaxID=1283287 RepID=UPI0003756040|nr:ABC transporter ATP-binding protein [Nocardioides sp. Iso805N]